MTCILEDMECYYEICMVQYIWLCACLNILKLIKSNALQSISNINKCNTHASILSFKTETYRRSFAKNRLVSATRHLGLHKQGFLVSVNRSPASYQPLSLLLLVRSACICDFVLSITDLCQKLHHSLQLLIQVLLQFVIFFLM